MGPAVRTAGVVTTPGTIPDRSLENAGRVDDIRGSKNDSQFLSGVRNTPSLKSRHPIGVFHTPDNQSILLMVCDDMGWRDPSC
jgi:hypothetical protein